MAALQQLLHQVLQLHEVGGRAKWVGEEDMEGKGGLYGKDKEKEEMHLGWVNSRMMYTCTAETESLVSLSLILLGPQQLGTGSCCANN